MLSCDELSSNGGKALETMLNPFLGHLEPVAPVLLQPAPVEAQVLSTTNVESLFDIQNMNGSSADSYNYESISVQMAATKAVLG